MRSFKSCTLRDSAYEIACRKAFNAGALSGRHIGSDTYVVYSYAEPIAVYEPLIGWRVSLQKWSRTTSRHATIVRCALVEYVDVESV